MKTKKSNLKRYIVRKYIMATSLSVALKKEPKTRPDDAYVDDDWKKENPNQLESAIGFEMEQEENVTEWNLTLNT